MCIKKVSALELIKLNLLSLFINQATWTSPDLPLGGIKNSSYGRELCSFGIQEFVNKKLIRINLIDTPS